MLGEAASAPILVLVAMAPPAPSVLGVSRRLLTSRRNPLDALQVERGGRARPRRLLRQIYQAGRMLGIFYLPPDITWIT